MIKISSQTRLPINFLLDYTLVGMTIVSLIFSLGNFWQLLITLPESNQQLIRTQKTLPRWENLPIQKSATDPFDSTIQKKPVTTLTPTLELTSKLLMISDDKIDQITKTLADKEISTPIKISPSIYQVQIDKNRELALNEIIEDKNLISSNDDELFLLEDTQLEKKVSVQDYQEIPTPDQLNLITFPSNPTPQEINKPEELATLASLPKDKYIGNQWYLKDPKLKLNTKLIIVAVIDGGVDISHPDLVDIITRDSDNQVLGWNYWDNTPIRPADVSSKLDEAYGHGTHIAGTIGARSNDIGTLGSCFGSCKVMPLKVFGGINSTGSTSNAVKAINYAVVNGAKIINLSWGSKNFNPILAQAIANAQSAGVTIVASAGNNSEDNILYPAKLEGVISVGSLDKEGKRSTTTNYGSSINRYAPGIGILATSIALSNTCSPDNQGLDNDLYNYCSGTSMAAAVTSGAMAKELSEKEDL